MVLPHLRGGISASYPMPEQRQRRNVCPQQEDDGGHYEGHHIRFHARDPSHDCGHGDGTDGRHSRRYVGRRNGWYRQCWHGGDADTEHARRTWNYRSDQSRPAGTSHRQSGGTGARPALATAITNAEPRYDLAGRKRARAKQQHDAELNGRDTRQSFEWLCIGNRRRHVGTDDDERYAAHHHRFHCRHQPNGGQQELLAAVSRSGAYGTTCSLSR